MRNAVLLFALVVAACSQKAIPPKEANELLKLLETIGSGMGNDRDVQTRMMYSTCGDLPSCAAGCQRALQACAIADPAQRGAILADCFSALKKEHAQSGIRADDWFRRYLSEHADRARPALPPEGQGRLDKVRATLQLTGS
jgi:hypothetical protein